MRKHLIKKIEKIMKKKTDSDKFFSLESFLAISSKIYLTVITVRKLLYRFNLIKSKKLSCFVISIGNIITGGTGKTPMTMYVAGIIKSLGLNPVIVTRGYKGTYQNDFALVSNGTDIFLNAVEAGDEALMMAESLRIPVIVGKNRYKAGKFVLDKFKPDVIILDDAFQHIALKRDLNLLLCDFNKPFGNLEIIPRGRLREPKTAIERSDAVILTRSETKDKLYQIQKTDLFKPKQVFITSHFPFIAETINCNSKIEKNLKVSVFLFSGIANNLDFKSTCKKMGMEVNGTAEFTDHYQYTKKDLENIIVQFKQSKAEYIVTTQKDYIKIKELLSEAFSKISLIVIGVKIKFTDEDKGKFENLIKTAYFKTSK